MMADRKGDANRIGHEGLWPRRAFLSSIGVASLFGPPLLAASPAQAQANETAGRVAEVRGSARAQRGGQRRELAQNDRILLGETLSTDPESRMTLNLAQNITLMLGSATRLRIDARRVGAFSIISLQEGAVLYDHRADGLGGEAQIESPYGLITVRGTRFFAGPSEDVFGVFVAEGVVDVTARGVTVTLERGFGTDIAEIGGPPDPPEQWNARRIRWALASVR